MSPFVFVEMIGSNCAVGRHRTSPRTALLIGTTILRARKCDKLFLGIDHSAIAIGDTNTSLRFYRDLLRLPIVGRSDNSGIEQEQLSGVPGAVVHITSLRASSGPGIEFLEYRFPQNGRPISPDERATDLIHREITLMTANAKAASEELRTHHARFISPDLITFKETELGFREGFVVLDPDGHALRIVEP
jgi:catechol 2,3-dioxygenase-like lactoylglutathione lyase family enzyme